MVLVEFDPILLQTLKDKVVVLTGGANGIGRAAVQLFHGNGANVVFGDVADASGTRLVAELSSPKVTFVHCDTTSYSDQLDIFAKAHELYGRIDIVVANAGISIPQDPFSPEADINLEPSMREIDVNLKGQFFTTRIGMSYLRQNGGGDIVLVSSIAGFKECTGLAAYTASKHGVIGLMRGLHLAAIKEGIRINVICPWMTKTQMVKGIEQGWEVLGLPTNQPEDVARSIVLSSTANRVQKEKTPAGAAMPFAGKILWVAGGQSYEIEDALQRLEPKWLGVENSRVLEQGQAYLMSSETSWDSARTFLFLPFSLLDVIKSLPARHFTMGFFPHTSYRVKVGLVFLSIILTAHYLFSDHPIVQQDYTEIYRSATSSKKSLFVQRALNTGIDGPFDNSTLIELCKSKTWTPGLIFKCESPKGGVGNVRNIFLNCVRYAIEAGATSFIIPEIIGRGKTLATLHTDVLVPFTHYFDLEHFSQSLTSSCPQIHLIPHFNDLWDKPSTSKAVPLKPEELSTKFVDGNVLAVPGNWSIAFKDYLNTIHPSPFSTSLPALVSVKQPILQFPLSYDDPHFVANFGKILRFREDVRRLAATVQFAMSQKYEMGIEAGEEGIFPGRYYGAHLRTAPDAKAARWTPGICLSYI
ncbi:hypothetical protein G7Y89_g10270 [Cudoniella acicularis]|uniref:NAD(P)-binding protein n=1 Tax=Cudoniella acicularis TaxID=354080 RepID=A0A8H4RD33_9HELO|nr:hypothetical protein G7Y89_g10270 [Cudoniella acicularis]